MDLSGRPAASYVVMRGLGFDFSLATCLVAPQADRVAVAGHPLVGVACNCVAYRAQLRARDDDTDTCRAGLTYTQAVFSSAPIQRRLKTLVL